MILSAVNTLFAFYIISQVSKIMTHIQVKFILDKPYFFLPNQKFTLKWLLHKLHIITKKKHNKSSHLMFFSGVFVYLISTKLGNFTLSSAVLEALIFILILTSCIMDIKTMSIDTYLSYTVLILLIAHYLLLGKFDLFNLATSTLVAFLSIAVPVIIMSKRVGSMVVGGADIDFFIGMIIYFSLNSSIIFIFLSGLFGVSTRLLIHIFHTKDGLLGKQFPFLPGISLAFYSTRIICYYNLCQW